MKLVQQYMEYDHQFAKELLSSFILNIIELRNSLPKSVEQKDVYIFLAALSNAHTTLEILDNTNLHTATKDIQQLLGNKGIGSINAEIENSFTFLCNESIKDLERDMTKYKTAI